MLIVVIVVAVGEVELNNVNKSASGGTREIDISIIEDNPVLQLDHFYPDTIYVPLGQNITLAVENGDDEERVFTLNQYDINVTMPAGTAQRVVLHANALGNFTFVSPITSPSPASAGRKGPCLEGFFVVTQNAALLSTTTTGTGVAPTPAAAAAAAAGPIGSCSVTPLTAP